MSPPFATVQPLHNFFPPASRSLSLSLSLGIAKPSQRFCTRRFFHDVRTPCKKKGKKTNTKKNPGKKCWRHVDSPGNDGAATELVIGHRELLDRDIYHFYKRRVDAKIQALAGKLTNLRQPFADGQYQFDTLVCVNIRGNNISASGNC